MTHRPSPRGVLAWLDPLSGGTWVALIVGGLSVLMATFAVLAPGLAPPGPTGDGPGLVPMWVLSAGLLAALSASTVPAAVDAAALTRARVLPGAAPPPESVIARRLVGGGTVVLAALVGLVAAVDAGSPGVGLVPALALVAWSGAVVLATLAWVEAGRPVGAFAPAALTLAGAAVMTSPVIGGDLGGVPPGGSRWTLVVTAAVAGAAGTVALFVGLRRAARRGARPDHPAGHDPLTRRSARGRFGAWFRSWGVPGHTRAFDGAALLPIVWGPQIAMATLWQLNRGGDGPWTAWGGDVTWAWPLWIVGLAGVAAATLRGGDLHWRWLLAPAGTSRQRLALRLVAGTWRHFAGGAGTFAIGAAAGWLLLTPAGAAAREAGALHLVTAILRHAVPALVELWLVVAIGAWARALTRRPEWPALGLVLIAGVGFAVALEGFGLLPGSDGPPALWPRDLGHVVLTAVLAATCTLAARARWTRVDWLAAHAAAGRERVSGGEARGRTGRG